MRISSRMFLISKKRNFYFQIFCLIVQTVELIYIAFSATSLSTNLAIDYNAKSIIWVHDVMKLTLFWYCES